MNTNEFVQKVQMAILAVFSVLVMSSAGWAATYYVDATNGNDNNNGLSTSIAWKTIAKVNSSSFKPGDSVLFKRGCTFREKLTVPSSGSAGSLITFGAYESGNRPIINGSDLVTNWTENSGTPNTWKATVTTQPYAVWFNSTLGNLKGNVASFGSPGDWYWSSNTLYVYSTSNPATAYTNPGIESSSRQTIYMSDKSFITLENIKFDKGGNQNVNDYSLAIRQSSNIVVQDCDVTNSVNIGINIFNINGTTGDTLVQRCTFNGTGLSKDSTGAHSAIQTWKTTDTPTITVQNNTFQDIDLHGAHHGHGIYALSGKLIWRYNYHMGDNGPVRAGAAVRLANTGGSQVYNNIFSNDGGTRYWGILATTGTHYIYNNVFYNNNYAIRTDTGEPTVVVKNNIFFGTSHETWYYLYNVTGTYQGDNNIFYGASNGWKYQTTFQSTFSDWKVASGQDANSISSDPKFTNPAANDFTFQSSSPAIDAGVNLGSTYQSGLSPTSSWPASVLTLDQNLYGLGWEIGAYVYLTSQKEINAPTNLRVVE